MRKGGGKSAFATQWKTRVHPRSSVVENFTQCFHCRLELVFRNRQRRGKAEHVGMLAFRQQDEAAVEHGFDRLQRGRGGRRAVRQAEFQPSEKTQPADSYLKLWI